MTALLGLSIRALAIAPEAFATLLASVLLLVVRAVIATTGRPLTRSTARLLDAAIAFLVSLFLILVVIRFSVLA